MLESPWVLIVGALAAVLTAGLSLFEQGWRIKETVMAPEPPQPAIRIDRQGAFFTSATTEEMRKIPSIGLLYKLQKEVAEKFHTHYQTRDEVGVWPIRLLVLNPNKERLTLHSCKVFAQTQAPFVSGSAVYFLGDTLQKFRADSTDPLIAVDAEAVRQVDVVFLFAGGRPITTFQLWGKLAKSDPKNAAEMMAAAAAPTRLDLRCEDQAGRTFNAFTTTRLPPEKLTPK